MITGALSDGRFDRFYAARVLTALVAILLFRKAYSQWRWSWSWPAVGIGILVFVLWVSMEQLTGAGQPADEQAIPQALSSMPFIWVMTWLVARVLGSALVVPLAEELAFRGYLVRRLIAADFEAVPATRFTWFSFLISSVLFGAMHQRWVAGTIAGILYAIALQRRGQLGDAVLAHATTNALIAVCVLITGAWSLWM
jgi:CAAX prenyl protease-like protein